MRVNFEKIFLISDLHKFIKILNINSMEDPTTF